MRSHSFPLIAALLGLAPAVAPADPVAELEGWLKAPRAERPALAEQAFAGAPLDKAGAERAKALLWGDHAAWIKAERAGEMKAKSITLGDKTMRFEMLSFGKTKPAGGRSLFISMHGGGNAAPQVNESQYQNQIRLGAAYKPAEGIYLAPRAPTDTWNLWHEAHIDQFFARIIENLIALGEVNPDRVYIMGYSAGGDGVYQLAPRMADRLAAAAMMAGHPNETQPLGLRNIGFALHVGAEDGGFNRNKVAAEFAAKLDALEKAEPGAYAHQFELHKGKGHWMELEDAKAVRWMEKFTRNPTPDKVAWRQDDVTHDQFYWLAIPPSTAAAGDEVIAERKGQQITIEAPAGKKLLVRLSDAMLDLDQPVKITAGKAAVEAKPERTIATLAKTLAERGDPGLVFSAEVAVTAE